MPLADGVHNSSCWCEMLDWDSALCSVVSSIISRHRPRHTNPDNMRRCRLQLSTALFSHYPHSRIKILVDQILEIADHADS